MVYVMKIEVSYVPILNDNYCWIIGNDSDNSVYVVDPGEDMPVINFLRKNKLTPKAILLTHKHADHTMGIPSLKAEFGIPVYGPEGPGYNEIEHFLHGGENLELWKGVNLAVVFTPGHIAHHLCFVAKQQKTILFCGDTLFSAGCGRLLGGTIEQLKTSIDWIKTLPDDTAIYCTHEYTLPNLAFAQAVEPENKAIQSRINEVNKLRANNSPSLPSTLFIEKQINPFIRIAESSVISAVEKHFSISAKSEQEAFTLLRKWKDNF